jgi:anti-anti-sigma factor
MGGQAQFQVRGIPGETSVLLVLQGELDVSTAPVLLEYLQASNGGVPENFCLDLSDLDYVDATGLRLLVTMHQRARADGTRFTLTAPSKEFLKLLEVTGLEDFFEFDGV